MKLCGLVNFYRRFGGDSLPPHAGKQQLKHVRLQNWAENVLIQRNFLLFFQLPYPARFKSPKESFRTVSPGRDQRLWALLLNLIHLSISPPKCRTNHMPVEVTPISQFSSFYQGQGKVHPRTSHEGPELE